MLVLSYYFTSRSVNKLYLLKGGQSLGLITDGFFGKPMNFKFDLAKTTFKAKRMDRKPSVI